MLLDEAIAYAPVRTPAEGAGDYGIGLRSHKQTLLVGGKGATLAREKKAGADLHLDRPEREHRNEATPVHDPAGCDDL